MYAKDPQSGGRAFKPGSPPPMFLYRMSCECTHEDHEQIKRVYGAFSMLAFVGFWRIEGRFLELRNCPRCGSTLAVNRSTIPATAPLR